MASVKKKHTVACSDIHCDLVLLTSSHLVSRLVTSAQAEKGGDFSRDHLLSLSDSKTMNWISKKRYQSPVYTLNNTL